MAELQEEQEVAQPDFERYLDILRRRHVHFLIPLFLGWLVVWGISLLLPTQYKSSTLILVQQPTMPENYVAPNVNENLQDRLQSITQQILSRTRLMMIIDKLQLYSDMGTHMTLDDKVEQMRKDTSIELVRDSRNNQITAFKINFLAHDPHVAQRVTTELTGHFINENLKVRQTQSEDTTKFIAKQLEDARIILSQQEARVRQFEGSHQGTLPSQQASNLQILSGLQGQLQNQQDSLNTAKQQRVYDQTLIEQYRNLHTASRTPDGAPTELGAIDQELTKLRAQLTDLSSRYTDSYPDVQKLRQQIARTERRRQEFLDAQKSASKGNSKGGESGTDNPTLLQLQGQLQSNQSEIANRERAIAGLESRINEYQARLNDEPATAQELAELTRGYDQSKQNYDDLAKKKNQSVIATSMEQMQQGERFAMLDPPSLPVKPFYPNHLKFCGMGIGVGVGLGVLIVVLFEFIDDRLHDEKQLKALLPASVIAEIPEVQGPLDEQLNKKRIVFGWAMAAFVLVAILIGTSVSYLRG
jgi:polysaccharide chain length determinant protein (PEP-CTERM system associated)